MKMMLIAMLLPCAPAQQHKPKVVHKPCPQQEAQTRLAVSVWQPGRGFSYARY